MSFKIEKTFRAVAAALILSLSIGIGSTAIKADNAKIIQKQKQTQVLIIKRMNNLLPEVDSVIALANRNDEAAAIKKIEDIRNKLPTQDEIVAAGGDVSKLTAFKTTLNEAQALVAMSANDAFQKKQKGKK